MSTLDILVNNAGVALYDDLSERRARTSSRRQPFRSLVRSRGTIVNNLAVAALAPLPVIPAHSISKAAAFSLM
ncbi:MAG: hypothetical protein HOW71_42900 [Nonomuraea sp.]|nr:hypothetical protein [Nonomuraea sp.]